jgi:hypothetical protein
MILRHLKDHAVQSGFSNTRIEGKSNFQASPSNSEFEGQILYKD